MNPKRMSLKMKLIGFIVILLIFANLGIGIPSYFLARKELENKGNIILSNAVNMAIGKIVTMELAVASGAVTLDEAQEQIKTFLIGPMQEDGTRLLRTPIDLGKAGYFIAYDDQGFEVMHPTLEGENVYDVVSFDDEELYIVQEQLHLGRNGGFLEYNWYYPNEDRIGRKLSYSKYEANWGWTIVATAYASDFNESANRIMFLMIFLFTLTLVLGYVVATINMKQILEPILSIIKSMKSYEQNKLLKVNKTKRTDELLNLVNGYNQMIDSLSFNLKALKIREKELKKLAFMDELSGLPNMNMMAAYVERQIRINDSCGYFILLDIKELKMINSIYGLSFGDDIIKVVSQKLRQTKPTKNSFLTRLGGNEFGIWVTDVDEDFLLKWIEDTHLYWQQEFYSKKIEVRIGFNIAYVECLDQDATFDSIVQKANAAMQYAKSKEVNTIKYSYGIYDEIEHESILKIHAAKGMENNEFYPVYQEKVCVKTEEVVGVEALARWESDVLGFVSPSEFIPILNKTKLILDFTEKMIEYILADFKKLTLKYNKEIEISINISPLFFISEHLVSYLLEKASEYKVPTHCIILEITEDVLIDNPDLVNKKINALRHTGIKVALDDFGTGYSSLNYLQKIDFDEIKIDKSFIDNIAKDKKACQMLHSIIDVIHNFGCNTVAEGVETKEQLEIVKTTGCKVIQGYYYSKPERLQ